MDKNKIYVAKSYQNLPFASEEYTINGKSYIKVMTKNGPKQVRTYTEKEYARFNPPVKIVNPAKSRREVLGFGEEGYIWIFKGNTPNSTYENLDFFRASPCRYARAWGWYLPSDMEMPSPLPVDITPIKLFWEDVSLDDKLIDENDIIKVVDGMLYDKGKSKFVGKIGDKIEADVTCSRMSVNSSAYGDSYFYVFIEDETENIFIWSTTAKVLEEGTHYHIKGTIKGYNTYKGNEQTTLTRCRVEEI